MAHYSYTTYADARTAEGFDTLRFGGPIGALVAEDQERTLVGFLGDVAGQDVIDVGTGTGRVALALARRGALVTGVDASVEMLSVAARRASAERASVTLTIGDAHALAFADRSFDVAVSLRLLMHAPDWRRCLAELCRVARRRIVFDYPALWSAAAWQACWRRAAATAGARVEAYRVLSDRAIARAVGECGFHVTGVDRQFVLPIALHKAIGSRRFTEGIERALASAGLRGLIGSPVTVVADRCTFW